MLSFCHLLEDFGNSQEPAIVAVAVGLFFSRLLFSCYKNRFSFLVNTQFPKLREPEGAPQAA
jgi:hypothetical protein